MNIRIFPILEKNCIHKIEIGLIAVAKTDICILQTVFFNKNLIEVVQGPISLVKSLSGGIEGNYRIAQHLIIKHKSYTQKIALYIVHWTQYGRNEDGFNKAEAAFNLSCDIKGMEKSIPFVVCIGDFNVEPYSEAFSHMGVSREREYTVKRGGLYNPFWKYLADSGTINYENHCTLKCSTPTFDQILLNQNILLSDAIIKADVLSDFNNPLKGEHWPIRLVLTFLHEPQEISI